MSKFYIQSGYQGKEVASIMFSYDRSELKYSAVDEYAGEPIVGSVEFVEQYIGQKRPNYFPLFLKRAGYLTRYTAWLKTLDEVPENYCYFIKPADRHKRFDARIVCNCNKYEPNFYSWQAGPYWISDIVNFKEEWRYYVAQGKILAAYWYQGEEIEIDSPELDIDWPKDFCGAVDFGRLDNGRIALVENNLPYACGWYGPSSEGRVYGEWLEKSWNYVLNCK
jgi:hypothetical protein